jgi:excinuclease UvrABC nuclease subunit
LVHFGSIEAIREASVEDIQAVKGMTSGLAQIVKESL